MEKSKFFNIIQADFFRYRQKYSMFSLVKLMMSSPGFRCVFILRIQQFIGKTNTPYVPQIIRLKLINSYGMDCSPGSKIGPGLRIEHSVGIVIGASTVIGKNATIMHGVTIGERYVDKRSDGKNPQIGDDVIIGISAIILGDIKIGDRVKIHAQSLVLKNVDDDSTISGKHK